MNSNEMKQTIERLAANHKWVPAVATDIRVTLLANASLEMLETPVYRRMFDGLVSGAKIPVGSVTHHYLPKGPI